MAYAIGNLNSFTLKMPNCQKGCTCAFNLLNFSELRGDYLSSLLYI